MYGVVLISMNSFFTQQSQILRVKLRRILFGHIKKQIGWKWRTFLVLLCICHQCAYVSICAVTKLNIKLEMIHS